MPSCTLPQVKEPPVPTVQEAGWAPEPVWMQRLEKKILCLCQGANLGHPVHSHTLYWLTYLAHNLLANNYFNNEERLKESWWKWKLKVILCETRVPKKVFQDPAYSRIILQRNTIITTIWWSEHFFQCTLTSINDMEITTPQQKVGESCAGAEMAFRIR
jgi:hypothetical protein